MPKQFLHLDDHLAMLNEYAPFQPTMHLNDGRGVQAHFVLVGIDFSEKLVLTKLATGGNGNTNHWHVSAAQLVLYSLADLPKLPGGDVHHASPVAAFIHALNFIQRGDYAKGEWVNQVKVKSASDTQLHLAFSTTYIQDTAGWSNNDFDLPEPEDNDGADYEVTVSATGTVHWRNVTADNLDTENKSRPHWRIAEGANVFEAFLYLRQLHVAVGKAAYVHQIWNGEAGDYDKHYSYVRKQVPAVDAPTGMVLFRGNRRGLRPSWVKLGQPVPDTCHVCGAWGNQYEDGLECVTPGCSEQGKRRPSELEGGVAGA